MFSLQNLRSLIFLMTKLKKIIMNMTTMQFYYPTLQFLIKHVRMYNIMFEKFVFGINDMVL